MRERRNFDKFMVTKSNKLYEVPVQKYDLQGFNSRCQPSKPGNDGEEADPCVQDTFLQFNHYAVVLC